MIFGEGACHSLGQGATDWLGLSPSARPFPVASQGKDEVEAVENIKEAITALACGRGPEGGERSSKKPDRQPIVVAV